MSEAESQSRQPCKHTLLAQKSKNILGHYLRFRQQAHDFMGRWPHQYSKLLIAFLSTKQ